MMSKGDIGIREVVILIIFIAVLIVSLLIILAIRGELGVIADRLNIPTFGELFQ